MLGLNSKISEYTAAIALATLKGFQAVQERRKTIIGYYRHELQQQDLLQRGWSAQKMQGQVPLQFFSLLSPDSLGNREVIRLLASHSIEARTYFSPACHQQKQFQSSPHSDLQVTERIADRIVSLPLWEEMNKATVGRIVKVLGRITEGNAL
ncbi:aminotransferase-like protein [Paenibacillus larvae subsp. larvae B-3650]|nr:aminotransferase-like protein [Paenibacillus larvae subsp. larvae B-3650]